MRSLNLGPDLSIPLEEVIGQCVAILGIRGSGKSNTAGVIFEELLSAHYPLAIVDIDGEYFGLKEKYEVLVVGAGDNVDIELDADSAPGVAELSLREGVPVILDVSDMLAEEREEFLLAYLTRLWSLAGKLRKPYMIGIEECHEFIPQGVRTDLKEVISRIALRGRKRGLGAVIVSQRSAKVEKDVLTQAGMLFLHRVVHEVDMRVYSELLPWPRSEVKEQVASLGVGECIFLSGQSVRRVRIRKQHTFHGGYTPSFKPVETPKLLKVRGELLSAIQKFKEEKATAAGEEELRERLERLEAELALKEARLRELAAGASQRGGGGDGLGGKVGHRVDDLLAEPPEVPEEPDAEADPAAGWQGSFVPPPELPGEVLRKVDRLIRRLEHLPVHKRRMLGFLAGKEPRAYTTWELASWIDCAEATLVYEPPRELLEMGLLFRERFARGTTYRAQLKEYVNRHFSGFLAELGPRGAHALVEHLRGRLTQFYTLERNLSYLP